MPSQLTRRMVISRALMLLALLALLATVLYDRTDRYIDSVQRFVICKPDGTLAARYEYP
jgi:RecB family endonuclease NucS